MSNLILFFIFFLSITLNLLQLRKNEDTKSIIMTKSKISSFYLVLNKRTIVFPEKGRFKTEFYTTRGTPFWEMVNIKEIRKKDFSLYSNDVANQIPPYAEKTCFYVFNICAYWLKNEEFNEFYFIDSPPDESSIFKYITPLLSPKLLEMLEKDEI